ncbi:MAG: sensor domain-containing diguanylate cyclase [Solirubrobacteraceae bacterium]
MSTPAPRIDGADSLAALAAVPAAVLVFDAGDRVVWANAMAAEMFASDGGAVTGHEARALLSLTGVLEKARLGVPTLKLEGRRLNRVPFAVEATLSVCGLDGREHGLVMLHERDKSELHEDAQRYFDVAFESAPIGMGLFNTDGQYVRVNAALCALLGRSAAELIGRRDQEFTHPDDRQADIDAAWEILDGRASTHQTEKRFVRPDGTVVSVIANLTFLRDDEGRPLSWVGQFQDITARRAAEDALRAERDLSQAVIAAMEHGVALTRDGEILAVNDALCRLTGFSADELVGSRLPFPFIPPESHEDAAAARANLVASGGGEFDIVMMRRDGTRFHAGVSAASVRGPDGAALGLVNTVRDVSERRRHEDELARRASLDGLTGLLNRSALDATLRVEVERALAEGRPLTLALLDLDHFKAINDEHGHPVGDSVLVETARRLRALSRDSDHLGRVGGEAFAWILPDTEPPAAARAAERACAAVRDAPFAGAGDVTISIGVCALAHAGDADELYRRADRALYAAKRAGRDRAVVWEG